MQKGLVAASAALLAAITSALPAQQASPRVYSVQEVSSAPQIDLWLGQVDYRYGDRITPFFDTDPGAYVTVLRVTSDGMLTVLYPRRPRDQEPFEQGQLVGNRVPFSSFDGRFNVNESDGIGFVFAIASFRKFNYSYFSQGGIWSSGRLAYEGGIGDPFEILRRFVDRTLGDDADFSMDYVSYRVTDYGSRTRYASRYSYNTYDDYYDSCLNAFGFRYTSYCRNAYPGYFGPIIVSQPGTPIPKPSSGRNLAGKRIKPLTGDPVVEGAPTGPQLMTEGRVPTVNPAEAAAAASRRARMLREAKPRDREPTQVDATVYRGGTQTASPQRTEPAPRAEPTSPVWLERPPVVRAEPRVEQPRAQPPRVEQPRVEQPRIEQPRVEQPRIEQPRAAPPPAAAPVHVQESTPRVIPIPAKTKDN